MPWNPSGGEMWTDETNCTTCIARVILRKIVVYCFREREEGTCPVCKGNVGAVHGWTVGVGLIKDTPTIAGTREFRRQ
jgi:hypothetical protein